MFHLKRAVLIAVTVCMGAFAVGCGNHNVEKNINTTGEVVEANKDVEDTTGTEERVVVATVPGVHILDALGIPMVGVPTSSYDLPESVADVTRIGSAMTPDMEIIASLEPTVVISVDSLSVDMKSQFDQLGIESVFVNLSSYDGLKEGIVTLGERFGKATEAADLVKSLEEQETSVVTSIEGKEAPSVLIIFGAGTSFMVASESSYVGDLVKRVGGENVLVDAPSSFSPVDMEYLADKNPDYILFMSHANPEESLKAFEEEFATNEAWQNFDAVKNDKVIALDPNYFGMSANLQAVDAMQQLTEILYAE